MICAFVGIFEHFDHNGIVGVAGSNPVGSTTVKPEEFPDFQCLIPRRLLSTYIICTVSYVIRTCRNGR